MLNLPNQSYVAWRTCITVVHVVAILSTVLRIRTRYTNQQMWLDDYLVIVPMTADLVYCISPWVLPWMSPDLRTVKQYDLRKLWAKLLLLFIIIWFSRICSMLSLARIFPPGSLTRSLILSLAFLFALLFCSVTLLLALHCDPYDSADRHCVGFLRYDSAAKKYAYSIDIITDIAMVITPLSVLWNVKLPKLEKRVILVALSGGCITLVLFGAWLCFTFGAFNTYSLAYTIITTMLTNLVAAASLLSCNALVVVTTIFRVYRRRTGQIDEASGPQTTSDDCSNPTGPAPNSAPAFDLEKTKDAKYRWPNPNLDSTSHEGTGSGDSVAQPPLYTLTQITMDDYNCLYGPPGSTGPRSRVLELPATSATSTASVPGIT